MENAHDLKEESAHRRWLFCTYNAALVLIGVVVLAELLSFQGWTAARIITLTLFALLLVPVVYGFTTATLGFSLLFRKTGDSLLINRTLPAHANIEFTRPTAVIVPIFNEDVGQVFRRLGAMRRSLQAAGKLAGFHFFVLSDSNDPTCWIAEEKAWFDLCTETDGFGSIFYRKRRVSIHNKSGNVADFCRRWGSDYKYMIVLDADSLMGGETMVRLVGLMDRNPRAGIIQTLPQMVLGTTLFQRVYQFGAHISAGMFSAGMNYWQLNSATYWGHNAIVRIRPFMQHCAMPELPADCPLGRRILSHDTVEAALMRRAGFDVWLAYDLEQSFEEYPPRLIAAVNRDRRWCFGNLQHAWVVATPGIPNASRIHLLNGIMAYLSSPLWMLFLVWSVLLPLTGDEVIAIVGNGTPLAIRMERFLSIFVLGMLFIPKILAAVLAGRSRRAASFGGRTAIAISAVAEAAVGMLVAPILMVFHSRFVAAALTGGGVSWGSQERTASENPPLRDFVRPFAIPTLIGIGLATLVAWRNPALLPWMSPILLGLLFSIPLAYCLASERLGQCARRSKLFLTPPEIVPAQVLKSFLDLHDSVAPPRPEMPMFPPLHGVYAVVIDPFLNRLHASVSAQRTNRSARTLAFRRAAAEKLLTFGVESVTSFELRTLLWDADLMREMHLRVWAGAPESLHPSWNAALQAYRDTNSHNTASAPEP